MRQYLLYEDSVVLSRIERVHGKEAGHDLSSGLSGWLGNIYNEHKQESFRRGSDVGRELSRKWGTSS